VAVARHEEERADRTIRPYLDVIEAFPGEGPLRGQAMDEPRHRVPVRVGNLEPAEGAAAGRVGELAAKLIGRDEGSVRKLVYGVGGR
jgi:hypothetical protein